MNDGATPLFLAARDGHDAVVERLLAVPGVDANQPNQSGATPLLVAAQNGHEPCVRALIEAKAGLEAIESQMGGTALLWASAKGYDQVVRALIDAGANTDCTGRDGNTPLALARDAGHAGVCAVLGA